MPGEVLYGRDPEIAAIDGALDAVARGGMRLLTVSGEAGIGKTRLLAELRERAAAQGFVVLAGRASELEREAPLVPILDAFAEGLPPQDALDSLGAGRLTLLAGSFPSIEAGDDRGGPAAERWRLYRALADLLALIGAERPLLLEVDDLHWADPATAEFIAHLLRRPPPVSLLVALGSRPGEAAEGILSARRSGGAFDHIALDLAPLGREAAEPMLAELSGDVDWERAFARSGGNPLLLQELARAGDPESVPAEVAGAVRARIDALDGGAARILEMGAVVGDPWDVDVAKAMAGLDEGSANAALDQLEAHSLIARTHLPRLFAFRHPIVRSALLDALGAGAMLDAHAAAARELGRAGAPPLDRAPHLARAAVPGDADAAAILIEAARTVRSRAPSVAADWIIAARRADLESIGAGELAGALVEAGRLEEALDVIDSAESAAGPDLAVAGAGIERLLGRHESARRRLLHALETTEEGGPDGARVTADLAAGAYLRGDYAETLQWAGRAASLPADVHVAEAARATLMAVGNVHAGGPRAERDALAETALAAIAAAGEAELIAGAELGTAVSWGLLALDRLHEGLDVARRFAAAARSGEAGIAALPHDLAAALALGLLGRIPEAESVAEDAEQTARLSGNAQMTQWSLWLHGWLLLEGGELDAALAAAEESVEMASSLDDSASGVVARAVLGAILGARGDHERARDLVAAYDIDKGWICRWSPVLVEIDLALGDEEAARMHADRAAKLAPETGMDTAAAAATRAGALVRLLADEAPDQAADLALGAAERAAAAGATLELARDRLLAGRALLSTDRDSALAELTAAAKQAASSGGRRVEAEAVRELRGAGVRMGRGGSRASGTDGLSALSNREREVSSLVAEGLTNREIGARLFLSEKTIETHLTHVFQKLGLRSRSQLAARVGEEGFGDPLS